MSFVYSGLKQVASHVEFLLAIHIRMSQADYGLDFRDSKPFNYASWRVEVQCWFQTCCWRLALERVSAKPARFSRNINLTPSSITGPRVTIHNPR